MSYPNQPGSVAQTLPLCWGDRWIVGTPEQFQWLHGILKVVVILNLLDAVLTLFWVGTGLATEANVFLQTVVSEHPLGFVMAKTSLVSLGSWLLWQRRHHPLSVIGLVSVFVVYFCLTLHHLQFASWVVIILLS